jgi:hypothetical protein
MPEATLEVFKGLDQYEGLVVIVIEHVPTVEVEGVHKCAIALTPAEARKVVRQIKDALGT